MNVIRVFIEIEKTPRIANFFGVHYTIALKAALEHYEKRRGRYATEEMLKCEYLNKKEFTEDNVLNIVNKLKSSVPSYKVQLLDFTETFNHLENKENYGSY